MDETCTGRKVIVQMQSGEIVPPGRKKDEPKYIFPNHLIFRIFEQPKVLLDTGNLGILKLTHPKTELDVLDTWIENRYKSIK